MTVFFSLSAPMAARAATAEEQQAAKAYRDYYKTIRSKKNITAEEIKTLQKNQLLPAMTALHRKAVERQHQFMKSKGFKNAKGDKKAKGGAGGSSQTGETPTKLKIESSRSAAPKSRETSVDIDPSQIPKEIEFSGSGKKGKKK